MQLEEDFFFLFKDYECDYNIPNRFEKFLRSLLSLLESYQVTTTDRIQELISTDTTVKEWGLPAPFLIPESKIQDLHPLYRCQYTKEPIILQDKRYFAYLAWTPMQASKVHSWYIKALCGGHKAHIKALGKIVDSWDASVIIDEE